MKTLFVSFLLLFSKASFAEIDFNKFFHDRDACFLVTELESGKVVFREINGELPENKEVVVKYQARGSSLFINAIRGEQENITEDVAVWRLVNNEDQFVSYLENKLNKLLGK